MASRHNNEFISKALVAIDNHVSSVEHLFRKPIYREHCYTPEEGRQLYKAAVDEGQANLRILNALHKAKVPANDCSKILENLIESENLEATQILLDAGAKPTNMCIKFAVMALDMQMIDLLLEYGASHQVFRKELENLLDDIGNNIEEYESLSNNDDLIDEIAGYLEIVDGQSND